MNTSHDIRVVHDPPLDGAENMARDEALLIHVGRLAAPPTLRLYQWSQPTVSLGYFQRYSDYEALPAALGRLRVVRRLTGGGAILHDLELTYSLTLSTSHPLLSGGPNALYALVHNAVIGALASLGVAAEQCGQTDDSTPTRGPFFCFERRHCFDVLTGGEKIAGSAQRRTREAVLQHGSIILGNRYARHMTGTVPLPFEEGIRRMRRAFVERFAEITGRNVTAGEWAQTEVQAATALRGKYAGEEWVRRM